MADTKTNCTIWGPSDQAIDPTPTPEPGEVIVAFTEVGGHTWERPAGVIGNKVDVLIVGGGGAGNFAYAGNYVPSGGGGAGRVVLLEDFEISLGESVAITVGSGGSGYLNLPGDNGGDSSFAGYIAPGGGAAGNGSFNPASDGGSGGGSSFFDTPGQAIPGDPEAGFGNNGAGTVINLQGSRSGGGGGAGGPGELGTSTGGGNGGVGVYIKWADAAGYGDQGWFGGGGGAGILGRLNGGPLTEGGKGGGGAGGGPGADGEDAMPNTGGGGGGGGSNPVAVINSKGGDGGSGIVLIRYFIAEE